MQHEHAHPITRKWPAQFPDWLQLYSLPTPNGIKVSVMLEEIARQTKVELLPPPCSA